MENFSVYLNNISVITYLLAFFAGVGLSFTPCVYPLIPVIAGVIGISKETSKRRNFILSFGYVIGMAIVFSLMGIAAALTGKIFGSVQSSPWVNIIVGSTIILFALTLLDVIHLPAFCLFQSTKGYTIKKKTFLRAFIMGSVSGLIVAPCTTAVLGALLVYVSTTQNIIFGFSLLFTFAIGLGTVLIIVGIFIGMLVALPKSERLMRGIQKTIGFAMIILGGYFIFKAGLLNR